MNERSPAAPTSVAGRAQPSTDAAGAVAGAPVTVVLVEDHRVVREGTRQLLERDPGIAVIGEAGDAAEAIRLAARLRPTLMLVDVQLQGGNGVDVIRGVAAAAPEVRCVVLTAYDDYVYITEAFEAGACGYLLKTVSAAELVGAVRAAAAGATVTDERISRRLRDRWRTRRPMAERLTAREAEVLDLLVRGSSNKEMARALGVGLRTVEGYVSNVLAKCGVRSRTEAVLFAFSHGLAAPPPPGSDG